MIPIFVKILALVQGKVLDQRLAPDAFALHFGAADRFMRFFAGCVDDVQRHARHIGDHDGAVGGFALDLGRAGIGVRLWSGVAFGQQFRT